MTTLLGWLALAALIGANALFVAAEFAMTSADRPAVARLAGEGDRRAKVLQRATDELSFQLSSVQLGITVCSLLLGFVAEPVVGHAIAPVLDAIGVSGAGSDGVAVVVALVLATLLQMLLGELIPQNVALAAPLRVGRAVIGVHHLFTAVARPVVAVFDRAANGIVRVFGVTPQQELRGARSPAELRAMISLSAREGTLGEATANLLSRGLFFGHRTAAQVMTSRTQMTALRAHDSVAHLLDVARSTGHSRFPVYRADLDDIIGVAHVGAALGVPRERRESVAVAGLVVEPARVPEQLDLDALLRRLFGATSQLAVVVDEYGGTAGVVTVEDLVEELVGQVRDEYDAQETPEVRSVGDGWDLSGQLHKDELAELLGVGTPPGPFDTLGGLVLDRLGRFAQVNDEIHYDGWRFSVARMDGRRIDRVLATPMGDRQ